MKLLLAAIVALAFSVGAMAQEGAAPANPPAGGDAMAAPADAKKDDTKKDAKKKHGKKKKSAKKSDS